MMEKNSDAKWGNWIGYVLLPFTIGIRDDPLDYVREAKATIDRKKHSLEVLFTFSIVELVLKLFGIKVIVFNFILTFIYVVANYADLFSFKNRQQASFRTRS